MLELYQGPFLGPEGSESRFAPLRQRLRNRLLRAAGELCRQWSERGAWLESARFVSAAIDADPGAEGLYRRLMLCYRDAGLAPEAMDVYEQCRRMCEANRDAEPSPETNAVFKLVLQAL